MYCQIKTEKEKRLLSELVIIEEHTHILSLSLSLSCFFKMVNYISSLVGKSNQEKKKYTNAMLEEITLRR